MMNRFPSILFALALAVAVAAVALLAAQDGGPQLDKVTLPPGFSIDVYAADVPNARQMALSPTGRCSSAPAASATSTPCWTRTATTRPTAC